MPTLFYAAAETCFESHAMLDFYGTLHFHDAMPISRNAAAPRYIRQHIHNIQEAALIRAFI